MFGKSTSNQRTKQPSTCAAFLPPTPARRRKKSAVDRRHRRPRALLQLHAQQAARRVGPGRRPLAEPAEPERPMGERCAADVTSHLAQARGSRGGFEAGFAQGWLPGRGQKINKTLTTAEVHEGARMDEKKCRLNPKGDI